MTKRILEIIPTLDRAGAEKQLCLLAAGLLNAANSFSQNARQILSLYAMRVAAALTAVSYRKEN